MISMLSSSEDGLLFGMEVNSCLIAQADGELLNAVEYRFRDAVIWAFTHTALKAEVRAFGNKNGLKKSWADAICSQIDADMACYASVEQLAEEDEALLLIDME